MADACPLFLVPLCKFVLKSRSQEQLVHQLAYSAFTAFGVKVSAAAMSARCLLFTLIQKEMFEEPMRGVCWSLLNGF